MKNSCQYVNDADTLIGLPCFLFSFFFFFFYFVLALCMRFKLALTREANGLNGG